MPRRTLRTAILRLSALTIPLLIVACCVAPPEVDPPSAPIDPVPSAPFSAQSTPDDDDPDIAVLTQFVRDSLPKWQVFVNGRVCPFGGPVHLDHRCQLVLIPEDGMTKPRTWIFLSAERYWMKGESYLVDDLSLSIFDALGILLALEKAGAEPPLLPSPAKPEDVDRSHHALSFEDGSPSPILPDSPPDDHTWSFGPPSHHVAPRPPSIAQPPSGNSWPMRPPRPNGPPDFWSGVKPGDRLVGKYPGWDKPHPGESWQAFRCHGKVYEGYKSDCPDWKPGPLGKRWVMPFEELVQHASDNLQHDVESLRTDKGCMTGCRAAMVLPGLLSTVCLAGKTAALRVPSVYAMAFAIFCQIFKTRTVAGGGYLGAALGVGWCKDSFCKPTEGRSLK